MSTQDQAKSYTVVELLAMPNDALNAMAAELPGATILSDHGDDYLSFGNDVFRDCNGKWNPVGNRNQSGELLRKMVDRGYRFDVQIGGNDPEMERVIMWPKPYTTVTVPGNDARAETVAFCAAMLAMKGRLSV